MKKIFILIKSFFYNCYFYRVFNVKVDKLNLGSSGTRIEGFKNIDVRLNSCPDILSDIFKLKLNSNTVDYIYNSHVFEHVPRHEALKVLKEWHRVLKPGAKLYLSVPDLEILSKLYLKYLPEYETDKGRYNLYLLTGIIYGGQINPYDYHFAGYSFKILADMLKTAGFKEIKKFTTIMNGKTVNDCAFLAKVDNVPISLNLEAVK